MPFKSTESNAHYYGKIVFRDWLWKKSDYNRKHNYKNVLSIFEWDCNDVNKGVLLEYPILSKTLTDGRKDILGLRSVWSEYPTAEQILQRKLRIEATIDLVIYEKGRIKYGIEIVHKHVCTKAKREFLYSLNEYNIDFPVYEVSASWILDQINGRIPSSINMVRV